MTDRGMASIDGSPACPFVALDDDRDARADRPDHRHRCFAEEVPAPRALAHQEAYCLSSAFPVCPTFQAWARREAAHARPTPAGAGGPGVGADDAGREEREVEARDGEVAAGSASAAVGPSSAGDGPPSDGDDADEWANPAFGATPIESTPKRNPPRDWAAPPPWATSGSYPSRGAGATAEGSGAGGEAGYRPRPAEGAGLAGSAADRLASGGSISDAMRPSQPTSDVGRSRDLPSAGPDAELAGLVGGATIGAAASRGGSGSADAERGASGYPAAPRSGGRPSVSSTRGTKRSDRDRLPAHESVQHDGPSWERARRYEAYPTIKTGTGLPSLGGLPRVALLAGALVIAAVALFFLPALLGVGGGSTPSASPNPTEAVATATPEPTPEPAPTPQLYTVKQNDTLSKIAKRNGVTLDQLLAANKDTIKNPDKISVGDQIIIPVPVPEDVSGASASPAT